MFVVQNIRSGDRPTRDLVEAFLEQNPDPGVRIRPADQLDLAMRTGQGLIAVRDGRIQAVSLVYQFDPGSGSVSYEIGTMRVIAERRGFQVFFACLHLMQIYLEDDRSRGDIFAVVTPGTASDHNLRDKVGMAEWTPNGVLTALRAAAGVPFVEGKSVLNADDGVISHAFELMRGWHVAATTFDTPKGAERIMLDLGWFDPTLLELR